MRHFHLALVWLVVSHFKAMLTTVIVGALDLVPLVGGTRHTIAVHVHPHHDDGGLAAATGHIGHGVALESVTIDFHVIAMLVHNGMVKSKNDVTAKAAQADGATDSLSAQRSLDQRIDTVLSEARLIGR